jgi:hypothetical protein
MDWISGARIHVRLEMPVCGGGFFAGSLDIYLVDIIPLSWGWCSLSDFMLDSFILCSSKYKVK